MQLRAATAAACLVAVIVLAAAAGKHYCCRLDPNDLTGSLGTCCQQSASAVSECNAYTPVSSMPVIIFSWGLLCIGEHAGRCGVLLVRLLLIARR
jgi:hypothetical protein